jgi:PAS domain S-box-containing protein
LHGFFFMLILNISIDCLVVSVMIVAPIYRHKHLPPLIMAWEFIPRLKPKVDVWEAEWQMIHELNIKNRWKLNIDLNSIVKKQIKTVVITNSKQQICFVNRNFEKMTGYDRVEVIGRKPNFLQGNETSCDTRFKIKAALSAHKPISTTILNYKKNGEKYYCKVELLPIFNQEAELVNFLAIEEEIN